MSKRSYNSIVSNKNNKVFKITNWSPVWGQDFGIFESREKDEREKKVQIFIRVENYILGIHKLTTIFFFFLIRKLHFIFKFSNQFFENLSI